MFFIEPEIVKTETWTTSYYIDDGCILRVPLGNEAEYARDVLGFPSDYFIPCFIGIGRPEKDIRPVKQKDINIRERIHRDKF